MALTGRNHDGVVTSQVVDPGVSRLESHVSVKQEEEQEFTLMHSRLWLRLSPQADDLRAHETSRRFADSHVPTLEAVHARRFPPSLGRLVKDETLAGERAVAFERGSGKQQRMIRKRFVIGRARHFDDLETAATLQDPMTDLRRLQNAVSYLHDEGFALIFVDQARPSPETIDQLESNPVEVDVVGNGPILRDLDVGRDEASALAIRNEIAIAHPCPPFFPAALLVVPAQNELGNIGGKNEGGLFGSELDD